MSPPPDGVNAQSRWPCERLPALTVSILGEYSNIYPSFVYGLYFPSVTDVERTTYIAWIMPHGRHVKFRQTCELICQPRSTLRLCCHLTHWGQVKHICVSKLTIVASDNLNQCWGIVKPKLRNQFQWNGVHLLCIYRYTYIYIYITLCSKTEWLSRRLYYFVTARSKARC